MSNIRRTTNFTWRAQFPGAHSEALDLLDKLLVFDPTRRLTAEEALRHRYVEQTVRKLDAKRQDPPATPAAMDDGFELLRGSELRAALNERLQQLTRPAQPSEELPATITTPRAAAPDVGAFQPMPGETTPTSSLSERPARDMNAEAR